MGDARASFLEAAAAGNKETLFLEIRSAIMDVLKATGPTAGRPFAGPADAAHRAGDLAARIDRCRLAISGCSTQRQLLGTFLAILRLSPAR